MIFIGQFGTTVQQSFQKKENYFEGGLELLIDLVKYCNIRFYQCKVYRMQDP